MSTQVAVCRVVAPCRLRGPYLLALVMEATKTSETSVNYKTTGHYNSEDNHLLTLIVLPNSRTNMASQNFEVVIPWNGVISCDCDSRSPSPDIFRSLWRTKVGCCVQKIPPVVLIFRWRLDWMPLRPFTSFECVIDPVWCTHVFWKIPPCDSMSVILYKEICHFVHELTQCSWPKFRSYNIPISVW
jgi:hypothetical protein